MGLFKAEKPCDEACGGPRDQGPQLEALAARAKPATSGHRARRDEAIKASSRPSGTPTRPR